MTDVEVSEVHAEGLKCRGQLGHSGGRSYIQAVYVLRGKS